MLAPNLTHPVIPPYRPCVDDQGAGRVRSFDVFLVDKSNKVELVYVGSGSGSSDDGMELFPLGDRAGKATAVVIVGYGDNKSRFTPSPPPPFASIPPLVAELGLCREPAARCCRLPPLTPAQPLWSALAVGD